MAKSSPGVVYGAPSRTKATSREAIGRRCQAAGCETVLSTYNRAPTCYTHTDREYRSATHR